MKQLLLLNLLLTLVAMPAYGQETIYRCANEYTNTKPDARARGCKLVERGNATIIEGIRLQKNAAPRTTTLAEASTSGVARLSANHQKAQDIEARVILLEELKKLEARRDELKQEYNNGEPEKRSEETRNYQKYLDRVAALKANLARHEGDIAGIQRELGRIPATSTTGQ